ncbi:M23 family metallopeptidase [Sanguibacter inulinus]|uniref:M23 family metallopeptidase n=1 Tax=Sanguibacter inulinus TaxID=60922 RepID=A0A853EXR9_9MICO|nr:M23 family metallopeptidase [Sanguibacter inulinus]MBF0722958.1 M23 family metallopeptidase [Sanguibacter inulinus]NYS94103.1 M23 family metallopeptidase [Sanguibacter inulinus]
MWSNPCIGTISSRYGMRTHPITGVRTMHHGTDISAPAGTPVWSVAAGTVTFSQLTGSGGNEIWIQHAGGILTKYLHLTVRQASVGQTVVQGQQIGTVGMTGSATGNHLHFEAHVNGASQDPQPFMAARGVTLGSGTPTPGLPPDVEETLMAGPIRIQNRGAVHFVNIDNGAFVHIPNTEYNSTIARVTQIPAIVLGDRDADVIKEFCTRIRANLA